MIPRTATRGHSFKGAGLYYLHDRGAKTDERVAFTETRNLPTNDPHKGMKWMSYTAMNADNLKEQAGGDRRGRKATAGAVYSFSLAWHPEQNPQREEMVSAADSLMEKLGLADHQAVLVAHSDADHSHIHGIVNLVNPDNGKTAQVRMDHLAMSKWAQSYEEEHGKVYCQARKENNAERERLQKLKKDKQQEQGLTGEFGKAAAGEKKKEVSGFVKHREQPVEKAPTVAELYERSDSGRAFKAALQEQGYTLAKGDRRGFVLVDQQGKISSLSRQLKGQRAKDIKARLNDIEQMNTAAQVQQELQKSQTKEAGKEAELKQQQQTEQQEIYDREQAEVDAQHRLADAAEEHAKQQARSKTMRDSIRKKSSSIKKRTTVSGRTDPQPSSAIPALQPPTLEQIFKSEQQWMAAKDRREEAFKQRMNSGYLNRRREEVKAIDQLEARSRDTDNAWGRIGGRHQAIKDELRLRKRSLAEFDKRIEEEKGRFKAEMERDYPRPDLLKEYQEKLEEYARNKGVDKGGVPPHAERDNEPDLKERYRQSKYADQLKERTSSTRKSRDTADDEVLPANDNSGDVENLKAAFRQRAGDQQRLNATNRKEQENDLGPEI